MGLDKSKTLLSPTATLSASLSCSLLCCRRFNKTLSKKEKWRGKRERERERVEEKKKGSKDVRIHTPMGNHLKGLGDISHSDSGPE